MRWGAGIGSVGSDIGQRCRLFRGDEQCFIWVRLRVRASRASVWGENRGGGSNESMTGLRFSLKEFISAHRLPGNGPSIRPAFRG